MSAGIWFWIIYVVVLLCGGLFGFRDGIDRRWWGAGFIMAVLVGLLGWGVFGPPIR